MKAPQMKEIELDRDTIVQVEVKLTYATGGSDTHASPRLVQAVQAAPSVLTPGPQQLRLLTLLDEESLNETLSFLESLVGDLRTFGASGKSLEEETADAGTRG